ncbi:SDR family oxidoreductase [Streptomyces sp. NPDC054756]
MTSTFSVPAAGTAVDGSVKDLTGKVALVIGGTAHMGLDFARNFASRGASVIATYGNNEEAAAVAAARLDEAAEPGVRSEVIRGDATDAAGTARVFDHVVGQYGKVDIVIHVPGAIDKTTIAEATDEQYDRLFDLNTRSAFHTLREAARRITPGGRIIALSTSLTGLALPTYGLYSAAKTAVEVLVKSLAQEIGGTGTTVNIVGPGPIDTPFFHGPESPESVQFVLDHLSLAHRLGRVDDVTPLVAFLVSESARWIHGQVLRVNNGMV